MARHEAPFDVLDWDSRLFGYPVARLRSHALTLGSYGNALKAMKHAGVRLAYAITPWHGREARALIEQAGGSLVDRRMAYRKELPGTIAGPVGVEVWPGLDCASELESLALESGHYSRFRTDAKIPPHVFPELYLTWIRRSVRGEIAQAVLVSRRAGEITGMVTLVLNDKRAKIGLMAVHRAHRGEGTGSLLMEAAEAWSHSHAAETLDVETQGANTGACALYRAAGYSVVQEQAIYHVWLEPAP